MRVRKVVKIEDAANEYVNGKYHILIEKGDELKEDMEFNLLVLEEDKINLMKEQQRNEGKKKLTSDEKDKVLESQRDIVKKIIKQSFPTKDVEWHANVYTRFGDLLLLELHFIWQWRDREAFKILQQKKNKFLEEMSLKDLVSKNTGGE